MNRRLWIPVLFFGVVLIALGGFFLARPLTTARASTNPQATAGTYY